MRGIGWIPIALGTAALVAGLGSRKKRGMALALTAAAGVATAGAVRGMQHDRAKAGASGQHGASGGEPEVARSITIGKGPDELRRCWLDPTTLPQLMAGFATVRETGEGRMHWKVSGPLAPAFEWDSETVDDGPDGSIGWRSLASAPVPNEGSVRFHPAQGDRGTVTTLHVRFAPPGGSLSHAAVKLLGTTPLELMADRALRRFKSLVEAGEIPTTERQPAARADTH
ncbi:SRPBCC family protein [Piscinibacter koreensis]|uniref:SRPBCC family protein n=1 Tax=Piscinibacter koreensis TaxID=2742824 RepID=A0A7Y6NK97_9BURK|nr:SRPBCC family protein [Schlegelella koreensis]NUZ04659.1 SRPBCC family protein [Schlegelella koreensis]